jgi:hypothetical protein
MDGAEAGEGGNRSIHGPGTQPPYCLGWVASEESRRVGDRARREKIPVPPPETVNFCALL